MNKSTIAIFIAITIAITVFNTHNIYAYFWSADNATVILTNCKENCELKGTLRIKPFIGIHYLTDSNKRVTYLPCHFQ